MSQKIKNKDVITIREGSKNKGVFVNLDEKIKQAPVSAWLSVDLKKKEISLQGSPVLKTVELLFDLDEIIEFYNR